MAQKHSAARQPKAPSWLTRAEQDIQRYKLRYPTPSVAEVLRCSKPTEAMGEVVDSSGRVLFPGGERYTLEYYDGQNRPIRIYHAHEHTCGREPGACPAPNGYECSMTEWW